MRAPCMGYTPLNRGLPGAPRGPGQAWEALGAHMGPQRGYMGYIGAWEPIWAHMGPRRASEGPGPIWALGGASEPLWEAHMGIYVVRPP